MHLKLIRDLALFAGAESELEHYESDLRIYVLANAIMEDALGDEEKVKVLIKRLKQEKKSVDFKSC